MCYLLCKRYICMVELLQRLHEDPKYIHAMFSYDLEVVKKLHIEITVNLIERSVILYV